ncbi:MAG: hypothetical protein L3J96_03605 [Thermoplasmata archaeon]|nr:hypothetical protein [Thermoplasmata archaeon]
MSGPPQPRPRLRVPIPGGWRDRVAALDPTTKYVKLAEEGLDLADQNLLVLREIAETLKRIESILDDATKAEPEEPKGPPVGAVDP